MTGRASAFRFCCGRLIWMIGSECLSELRSSFVNKRSNCGGGSCKLCGVPNVIMVGTGDGRERFAWTTGGVKDEKNVVAE